MIRRYVHNSSTWIDLESPTQEEVKEVMAEFGLHPTVASELLKPSLKPKVDLYKDYVYLILHFPVFKHSHTVEKNQEVDFVLGRHFLITARYDTVDTIGKFAKELEVTNILSKSEKFPHAGYIFYHMIRGLYESLGDELDFISDSLKEIERKVFIGRETEMVREISKASRDLLAFKQSTNLHREILRSFEIASKRLFGEDFSFYAKAILNEYYKVSNKIITNTESVAEIRETNNSLLSTKQNEIMKTITIFAFIFLPFSIIASFFQMNTVNTPLVGQPYDWQIAVGIMFLGAVLMFSVAKLKKWL